MKPGTLLKMLLIQEEKNRDTQNVFYEKYAPLELFSEVYAQNQSQLLVRGGAVCHIYIRQDV